jgi:hypothetical protein
VSVLDFIQQAKNFSLEERTEIIAAIQQQLFEHRQGNQVEVNKNATLEVWSPDVDAASAQRLQERVKRRNT